MRDNTDNEDLLFFEDENIEETAPEVEEVEETSEEPTEETEETPKVDELPAPALRIHAEMERRAETDPLLAEGLASDAKSVKECYDFITELAKRSVAKGAMCACIEDETVFGWAVHYYTESAEAIDEEWHGEERRRAEEARKKAEEKAAKRREKEAKERAKEEAQKAVQAKLEARQKELADAGVFADTKVVTKKGRTFVETQFNLFGEE